MTTSILAQSTEKMVKKPTIIATQGGSNNGVIYFIDGVRSESALDFYNIKSEDIYSIEILNDQAEIMKRYARKSEKLKSVIVVETIKRDKSTETVVSEAAPKAKN
jgi:hypothetical protein